MNKMKGKITSPTSQLDMANDDSKITSDQENYSLTGLQRIWVWYMIKSILPNDMSDLQMTLNAIGRHRPLFMWGLSRLSAFHALTF